jgi:hypothetical protein
LNAVEDVPDARAAHEIDEENESQQTEYDSKWR